MSRSALKFLILSSNFLSSAPLVSTLVIGIIQQEANAGLFDTIKGWFGNNNTENPNKEKQKQQDNNNIESKTKSKENNSTNAENAERKLEAKVSTQIVDTKQNNDKSPESIPSSLSPLQEEGKNIVVFKDGTAFKEQDILNDINQSQDQYKQTMSFDDVKLYFAFKAAYEKILQDEVKKSNIEREEAVIKSIEKMQKSVATFSYMNDQVSKLMTKDALHKFYDETWDKHIKGTQQISLVLVNGLDKTQADKLAKEAKSIEKLNEIIKSFKDKGNKNITTTPLDDYPEGGFPPEIIKEIKARGTNSIVGPYQIQGVFSLFFVKSIHPAVKKPFSDEIERQYKQVANRDFTNKYIDSLIEKHKVTIYDLNGDKFDSKKKDDAKSKKQPILSNIKENQVIAKIGEKISLQMRDLYDMFNVKSLDNELFGSMAIQLKIGIEEVIQSAIKLCVQDKLLEMEIKDCNYMKLPKMRQKFNKIKQQQLRRAYFSKTVKITEADAKKEYNKYIKMMKPSDKDDQEISVRMAFYSTKEDAESALKIYQKQPKKFSEDFKSKKAANKEVIDLGYVKRQDADPAIWNVIKTSAPGVCCPSVIKIEGATYGFEGKNYAVLHIGDRRKIKLPSFTEVSSFFRRIAEKIQAVAIMDELMSKKIAKIDGKPYVDIPIEVRNKLIVAIISADNESVQGL